MKKHLLRVFFAVLCVSVLLGCGKSGGAVKTISGDFMNAGPSSFTIMNEDRSTGNMDLYVFKFDKTVKLQGVKKIWDLRSGQKITVDYTKDKDGLKWAKRVRVS